MPRDLNDLQLQLTEAIRRSAIIDVRIAEAGDVSAGDLYVFDVQSELALEWAVVLSHPDDEQLWFVVPADQNPATGTWDIAVPEFDECGPLTLRCGYGLWIHADDFDSNDRSGFIETTYVREAQNRLSQMVSGQETQSVEEVDVDPDYEEWMHEISIAVERLEAAIQDAEPQFVQRSEFDRSWADNLPASLRHRATALAADSGGLVAGPKKAFPVVDGKILETDEAGSLVAVEEGTGLRLQYVTSADTAPEVETNFGTGEWAKCEWRPTPGGFEASDLLPGDARVELRLKASGRVMVIEP